MSEVEKKIRECITELDPYKFFAPEIEQAVKALNELEGLVKNPSKENVEKAKAIATQLYQSASPYASYIPTTVTNMKFVLEWLEKKK